MKSRKLIGNILWFALLGGFIAACLGWFFFGLQHWLAIKTGTCPQVGSCHSGAGGYYGYWSGFGSVFPWSPLSVLGIFGGIALWYKKHNCHVEEGWLPWGCWRLGHYPDASGTFMLCRHHNPATRHKKLTVDFIHKHHHAHLLREEELAQPTIVVDVKEPPSSPC